MLERMKVALRVTNDRFDREIEGVIQSARMELIRAGVRRDRAESDDDELIASAIRAFVLSVYSTDVKMADGYMASFDLQKDQLRKTGGYMAGEAQA